MKILLEKYEVKNETEKILNTWTTLFDNIDDLLKFIEKSKKYLVNDGYKIIIRCVKENKEE